MQRVKKAIDWGVYLAYFCTPNEDQDQTQDKDDV
jgi:hypothetical protein